MSKYRMVSLDTSSTKTGWAYFESGKLKESGVIDCHKEKDSEIRLEDMCFAICDLLTAKKAKTVVIEMTVVVRNAAAQRMLSEIVGVVRGWSLCNFAEFVRLRPTEWRKLICKDGKVPTKRDEAKAWSIQMVKEDFKKIVSDDEADAILIGQARINQMNEMEKS